MVEICSVSFESPLKLRMIEDVWNHHIGERFVKWHRQSDCVTVYRVHDKWATWWQFWLSPNARNDGQEKTT